MNLLKSTKQNGALFLALAFLFSLIFFFNVDIKQTEAQNNSPVFEISSLLEELQAKLKLRQVASTYLFNPSVKQDPLINTNLSDEENVKKLQYFLSLDPAIYPEGLVTGFYGPLTKSAVERLESKFRLAQTGEATNLIPAINQAIVDTTTGSKPDSFSLNNNNCPADLNNDGHVNSLDLKTLFSEWGQCQGCVSDLNNDGVVNGEDMTLLMGAWGVCPVGDFVSGPNPMGDSVSSESNYCPSDLNNDGVVNTLDLVSLLSKWGQCQGCASDLNNDGVVNGEDMTLLLGDWGVCSGGPDGPQEEGDHNFQFVFAEDGYIEKLDWINSFGSVKTVVWDEQKAFPSSSAAISTYLHSQDSVGGPLGSWNFTNSNGVKTNLNHNNITYQKTFEDDDNVVITATDDQSLFIEDTITFKEDTMYVDMDITNISGQWLDFVIPVNLGSLILGNIEYSSGSNEGINMENTGLTLLRSSKGGEIIPDFNQLVMSWDSYPTQLASYSPVSVLWDDNLTVGQQILTELRLPVSATFKRYPKLTSNLGLLPVFKTEINLPLDADESFSLKFAYTVSDGGEWEESLQPYKKWFDEHYGSTPNYCPAGPITYLKATNRWWAYDEADNRFKPGTTWEELHAGDLQSLDTTEASVLFQKSLGLDGYMAWGPWMHSSHLTNDGSDFEFSPEVHLIDPNVDAASDPSKLEDFASVYNQNDLNFYIYTRICSAIDGADIQYDQNGNPIITTGEPINKLDLRDPEIRDRQIEIIDHFVSRGIKGVYFDHMGNCLGDEEFVKYAKQYFLDKYGFEISIIKEGARDREALLWPQISLLKTSTQPGSLFWTEHSVLLDFLVPEATYYAGAINNVLDSQEFDSVLQGGNYQGIMLNFPPHSGINLQKFQQRMVWSYSNRFNRWQSYGQSLGCPQPPLVPPLNL